MSFWNFKDNGKVFEINGKPQAPWSHILTNGRFGSIWSERGGAFCWCGNSVLDRLTRWDQDLVLNQSRRFIYLLGPNGIIRSLTPSPINSDETEWKVEYGPGSVTYKGVSKDLTTVLDVIVLPELNAEIQYVSIDSNEKEDYRLYSVQDILLGTWPDVHREFHKLFIRSELTEEKIKALIFYKELDTRPGLIEHWNTPFRGVFAAASSPNFSGFETDRYNFYGYCGSIEKPQALLKPCYRGKLGAWCDTMAGIDVSVKNAEQVSFVTAFGNNREDALLTVEKALEVSKEDALKNIRKFWESQLGKVSAETPSNDINYMASHWLKYQTVAGRLFARCGIYQASGAFGFRDQLQDSLIFLLYNPSRTLEQLKLHLEHQFKEGDVLHWWHPEINTGPRDNCSDDYLWPIMAAAELYKETGSVEFLNEKVKYIDAEPETIWAHLNRSVDRAWKKRSERGVPLLGSCDWNDGLSSAGDKGKGESIWVGHFLHILLLEMAELARARGESPIEYLEKARELRKIVNDFGWDGEWFIQGTTDEGIPIGSSKLQEGRIHLNPQTWSIIGRTAVEGDIFGTIEDENSKLNINFTERAKSAIESVKKMLVVEWGVLLLFPAYQTPDASLGYITRYAPGARENGGVYTHGAVWTARAARIIRDRELLHHTIFSLLPPVRGRDSRYRAEPYVTPGNIDGPITQTPGKGGWTWYTGSSGWLLRCIYEDLFGIRSMPEWMILDPMVPLEWNSFKVVRPWRGKTLYLNFERGKESGIEVEGKMLKGKKLLYSSLPKNDEVEVKVVFSEL